MSAPAAIVAAGDPASSRLVYAMVVGLLVIGASLVVLGVWLVRQTRRDLDLLAPLEMMGEADWAKQDPATQTRMLEALRPIDAKPLRHAASRPQFDVAFDEAPEVTSLSDLGPGIDDSARGRTADGSTRSGTDPTPIWFDPSAIWPERPTDR